MKTTEEIYKWLKSQNYQTEFGEQEYRMYYAIDMPKILEAYHESRMKEELIAFLSSMNQGIAYGLNQWAIKNYVDEYLATRKNK